MYCNHCGGALDPSSQFCATCSKPVIASPGAQRPVQTAMPTAVQDRVRRNVGALAMLWLAYGILRVVGVFWLFAVGQAFLPWIMGSMGGHGWAMGRDWGLGTLIPLGFYGAGAFSVVFAAAYLILAWGLYEKRPWARILGIVLGFLALLRFPFGTALGIYTLWVLLPENSRREYEQLASV